MERRKWLQGAAMLAAGGAGLRAAELPRPAPELQIRMTSGKDLMLSSFKGKVTVVEFLLTTCPHCQHCSQTMNRLYREMGPQGFQPVGVAVNEMANMLVDDYVRQFNLDFPVGWSQREPVVGFLQHPVMMMMSFPTLAIIDRAGTIRHQFAGGDEFFKNEEKNMRELLTPLIKAPGKAGATKKS